MHKDAKKTVKRQLKFDFFGSGRFVADSKCEKFPIELCGKGKFNKYPLKRSYKEAKDFVRIYGKNTRFFYCRFTIFL